MKCVSTFDLSFVFIFKGVLNVHWGYLSYSFLTIKDFINIYIIAININIIASFRHAKLYYVINNNCAFSYVNITISTNMLPNT